MAKFDKIEQDFLENYLAQRSKNDHQEQQQSGDDPLNSPNVHLGSQDLIRSTVDSVQKWFESNKHRFSSRFSERLGKDCVKCRQLISNGNEQFRLKNFEKALELYRQAIRMAPTDDNDGLDELSRCYSNRSLILVELNKPESALAELKQAIHFCVTKPNDQQRKKLLFRKLSILDKLQKYQEALKLIQEVILAEYPDLKDVETKFLRAQQETIEKKLDLQRLNSLNVETSLQKFKKTLKAIRVPLLVQKFDQELIENFLDLDQKGNDLAVIDSIVGKEEEQEEIKGEGDFKIRNFQVRKEVARGSLISIENPLMTLPLMIEDDQMDDQYCHHCLTELTICDLIIPCGYQCRSIYCSEKCRKESAAQYHQLECEHSVPIGLLEYLRPPNRLALRLLARLNQPITNQAIFPDDSVGGGSASTASIKGVSTSFVESFHSILKWARQKIGAQFELDRFKLWQLSLQTIFLNEFLSGNFSNDLDLATLFQIVLLFDLVIYDQLVESIQIDRINCDQDFDQILQPNYKPLIRPHDHFKAMNEFEEMLQTIISDNGSFLLRRTIAIALYPLTLNLVSADDGQGGWTNLKPLYQQNCKAMRASRKLSSNELLMFRPMMMGVDNKFYQGGASLSKTTDSKTLDYDGQFYESMERFFWNLIKTDPRYRKYNWIKLSLATHLAQRYFKQLKDFERARDYNEECLKVLKVLLLPPQSKSSSTPLDYNQNDYLEKLETFLLMRQARIQFEIYTDQKISLDDSIKAAKPCLMNASLVMHQLHQIMFALRLVLVKTRPQAILDSESNKHTWLDLSSGDLVRKLHPLLPLMIEVEDTMVTCDMFIQQFSKPKPKPE